MMSLLEFFLLYVVVPLLVLLLPYYIYWKFFIRVKSLSDFHSGLELRGKVVSVADGDGFEFYHVPWYFHLPWFFHVPSFFHIPSEYDEEPMLNIRLAGIDAPETGKPNSGKPAQHFSVKASNKLKELVLNKIVKLKLLGIDQYRRILATCYLEGVFPPGKLPALSIFTFLTTTNVNTKMVELGLACVYTGKGAIYDDYEDELLRLEAKAKQDKIGMWSREDCVLPMQFKWQHRN